MRETASHKTLAVTTLAVSKTDAQCAGDTGEFTVRWDGADAADSFGNWDRNDFGWLVGGHAAEFAVGDHLNGADPEAGAQLAVKGGGGTTAL